MRCRILYRCSDNTSFRVGFLSSRFAFSAPRGYWTPRYLFSCLGENVLIFYLSAKSDFCLTYVLGSAAQPDFFWRKPPYPLPGLFLGPANSSSSVWAKRPVSLFPHAHGHYQDSRPTAFI